VAWSGINLSSATLTLTNGVAVAVYGAKGLVLQNGAKFISGGDPLHFNHLLVNNGAGTGQHQLDASSTATLGLLGPATQVSPCRKSG